MPPEPVNSAKTSDSARHCSKLLLPCALRVLNVSARSVFNDVTITVADVWQGGRVRKHA